MSLPYASDDAPSHDDQHLPDTVAVDEEEVKQEDNSGAEKSQQVYTETRNLSSFETEPWSLLPKWSIVRP
jgi:hypothetical protein